MTSATMSLWSALLLGALILSPVPSVAQTTDGAVLPFPPLPSASIAGRRCRSRPMSAAPSRTTWPRMRRTS